MRAQIHLVRKRSLPREKVHRLRFRVAKCATVAYSDHSQKEATRASSFELTNVGGMRHTYVLKTASILIPVNCAKKLPSVSDLHA